MHVILSYVEGNVAFGSYFQLVMGSLCYAVLPGLHDTLLQPKEPSIIVVVVTPLTAIVDDTVCLQ